MSDYVKVCPRCETVNDETADACSQCNDFLGMVGAVPKSSVPQRRDDHIDHDKQDDEDRRRRDDRDKPSPALYIDVPMTGECFTVQEGFVIGQAHPTSTAQIQLRNIAGVTFVHRQHCRFNLIEERWHVTPIPQPDWTNPTFVNQQSVNPDQRCPVQNGDRLTLGQITLHIRIIEV